MDDINIDPFGEHDKSDEDTSERPEENIPLLSRGVGRGTFELDHKQETSLEERVLGRKSSENTSKRYIKSYPKAWIKPQKYSI